MCKKTLSKIKLFLNAILFIASVIIFYSRFLVITTEFPFYNLFAMYVAFLVMCISAYYVWKNYKEIESINRRKAEFERRGKNNDIKIRKILSE